MFSGVLSVDVKYEFTAHESTKDGNSWWYCCKYRLTQKVRCPAKARVIKFDEKWILQQADENHTCEPNRPKVIAELLRHKIKEIVRSDPVRAVGKAVRTVRVEAAEEYGDDKEFYHHLISELGTDSALEKQMLRVRAEVIGPTPRSRNMFNPEKFLKRIYGEKSKVIVCDLNKLDKYMHNEISETPCVLF